MYGKNVPGSWCAWPTSPASYAGFSLRSELQGTVPAGTKGPAPRSARPRSSREREEGRWQGAFFLGHRHGRAPGPRRRPRPRPSSSSSWWSWLLLFRLWVRVREGVGVGDNFYHCYSCLLLSFVARELRDGFGQARLNLGVNAWPSP